MFTHGEPNDYCPLSINEQVIKRTHEYKNIYTEKGSYFETLCIGSGLDGKKVTDLPRKKDGGKTLDQVRIEEQHLRFEQLRKKYNISIVEGVNTQIKIYKMINGILLEANMDIFPTVVETPSRYVFSIIDLKLTSDIHSNFGMFSWNRAASIDPIQAYTYMECATHIDLELNASLNNPIEEKLYNCGWSAGMGTPSFWYMIFDYSPRMNVKFIEVDYNSHRRAEFLETVRKTDIELRKSVKHWSKVNPQSYNCDRCALSCDARVTKEDETFIPDPHPDFMDIEYERI